MGVHGPITAMPLALGEVLSVQDQDGTYRVQVRLHGYSSGDDQKGEVWARVTAPFAGDGYGAVMLPGVGEQVLVGFVSGDQNFPVVLGALYHGSAQPAQEPVEGDAVKKWAITGKKGTEVLLDESSSSKVTIKTKNGVKVVVNDSGSKAVVTTGSSTMTIDPSGVTIESGAIVKVDAAMIQLSAGMMTVDAGISTFSGVVQCDALITNTVISSTYTPGAGNVW